MSSPSVVPGVVPRSSSRELPRLIALSSGALNPGAFMEFLARLRHALDAGLPGLLLREPGLCDAAYCELLERVLQLREMANPGMWIGVHDRLHMGLAHEVDGLHLGFTSMKPALARACWATRRDPDEIRIGFSAHAHDDPEELVSSDYLFLAPVRETRSKPGARPLGWPAFEGFVARTDVPTLALGGIRPEDTAEALSRGAHGVAVLSGILGAGDVEAATRSYVAAGQINAASSKGESRT